MTDEQNPTQEPTQEAEPPVPPAPTGEGGDAAALSREAAQRRRQLREVEAERDSLRSRLDERDRQDVERMAAERLADPADLWLSTSLDVMRGTDGTVDFDRAGEELDRVLREKPHWRKPEEREPEPPRETELPVRMPNLHQGPGGSPESQPPSFGQTVKRALGGH